MFLFNGGFCSGQTNMFMLTIGFPEVETQNYVVEYPNLQVCSGKSKSIFSNWVVCSGPKNVCVNYPNCRICNRVFFNGGFCSGQTNMIVLTKRPKNMFLFNWGFCSGQKTNVDYPNWGVSNQKHVFFVFCLSKNLGCLTLTILGGFEAVHFSLSRIMGGSTLATVGGCEAVHSLLSKIPGGSTLAILDGFQAVHFLLSEILRDSTSAILGDFEAV